MFYTFFHFTISIAIRFFFKNVKLRNHHNIISNKPLIIISNHPSAFMDPLVHAIFVKHTLYYLARADVFSSKFGAWIARSSHIAPIYRMVEDGVDSLKKNDEVFDGCYRLLANNKTILLFGEGVTDDTFVRRIKPLKKGPVRIALGVENKYDFNMGVNIVCAGLNYTNPSSFRSDILISLSEPIDVRRYKELFEENNSKAMRMLNEEIYKKLKSEVVYLEDKNLDEFFEQLLIISGKGMSNKTINNNHKLVDRWKYSVDLANKINQLNNEDKQFVARLKEETSGYFKKLENLDADDSLVYEWALSESMKYEVRSTLIDFLLLLLGFPLFLFGLINNYLPYKIPDLATKKIIKRPVFYSSINMLMGMFSFPLFYVFTLLFVQHIVNNWLITAIYACLLPVAGLFAFNYTRSYQRTLKKFRFNKVVKQNREEVDQLLDMRRSIVNALENLTS